jgi:hypothetical protein
MARGSVQALIRDLEQVDTQPSGLDNPGYPKLDQDPRVKALIRKGPAAIAPLARCMASDTRLTRSNDLWWGGTLSGNMVPVAEAASVALRALLEPEALINIERRVEVPRHEDGYPAAFGRAVLEWLDKQPQGPPGAPG